MEVNRRKHDKIPAVVADVAAGTGTGRMRYHERDFCREPTRGSTAGNQREDIPREDRGGIGISCIVLRAAVGQEHGPDNRSQPTDAGGEPCGESKTECRVRRYTFRRREEVGHGNSGLDLELWASLRERLTRAQR